MKYVVICFILNLLFSYSSALSKINYEILKEKGNIVYSPEYISTEFNSIIDLINEALIKYPRDNTLKAQLKLAQYKKSYHAAWITYLEIKNIPLYSYTENNYINYAATVNKINTLSELIDKFEQQFYGHESLALILSKFETIKDNIENSNCHNDCLSTFKNLLVDSKIYLNTLNNINSFNLICGDQPGINYTVNNKIYTTPSLKSSHYGFYNFYNQRSSATISNSLSNYCTNMPNTSKILVVTASPYAFRQNTSADSINFSFESLNYNLKSRSCSRSTDYVYYYCSGSNTIIVPSTPYTKQASESSTEFN